MIPISQLLYTTTPLSQEYSLAFFLASHDKSMFAIYFFSKQLFMIRWLMPLCNSGWFLQKNKKQTNPALQLVRVMRPGGHWGGGLLLYVEHACVFYLSNWPYVCKYLYRVLYFKYADVFRFSSMQVCFVFESSGQCALWSSSRPYRPKLFPSLGHFQLGKNEHRS